jgi:hypothetical protein
LDKIQRHPLSAQQRPGRASNFQQNLACFCSLAIADEAFGFDGRRMLAKSGFREPEPGDDQRFAGAHDGASLRVARNRGERRHVATADIFGKRGADGAADFCDAGLMHNGSMSPDRGAEKQKASSVFCEW